LHVSGEAAQEVERVVESCEITSTHGRTPISAPARRRKHAAGGAPTQSIASALPATRPTGCGYRHDLAYGCNPSALELSPHGFLLRVPLHLADVRAACELFRIARRSSRVLGPAQR